MEKLKVVHIVAGLWRENGGPSVVIPNLCIGLLENNCDVSIVTVDGDHSDELLAAKKMGVKVYSFKSISWTPIRYCFGMNDALKDIIKNADIVHNHGLWLYPNWLALKWSKHWKKPLVLTPHGVLDPNLFNKKRYKKILPWILVDKNIVKYSSLIIALSDSEKIAITATIHQVKKKIKIIPNGVSTNNLNSLGAISLMSDFDNYKKILFLSRVAPIKGVENLLKVWQDINASYPDWRLIIAGPVDDSLKDNFCDMRILSKHNICFIGSVFGSDKRAVYEACDVFVLPSYGEGLPTVILEAMSFSKPIIYTTECNFPMVSESGAGMEYRANDILALKSKIELMISLSSRQRIEIGQKGRALVENSFSWESVSREMSKAYMELLK